MPLSPHSRTVHDLRDDGAIYRKRQNIISRFIKNERKRDTPFVEKEHDASRILSDIAREEQESRQASSDYARSKSAEEGEVDDGEARLIDGGKDDKMLEVELQDEEQKHTPRTERSDKEIRATEERVSVQRKATR